MHYQIIAGEYTLTSAAMRWAIPGTFPRRYWDIVEYEHDNAIAPSTLQKIAKSMPLEHACARCKRSYKAQYTHCYRCNQYLKVKANIG